MHPNGPQLGKLITDKNPERDAIHVAVVPMIAGEYLYPGNKVRLKHNSKEIALSGDYNHKEEVVGVVDPFLSQNSLEKGEKFWCFLFPNTVTGMRHHWEHPIFDSKEEEEKTDKNEHEDWLYEFCDEWNFDFDELIEQALSTDDWRYVVARGTDLHSKEELGEDYELFWYHLEKYTGKEFTDEHKDGLGWSCSC